MTRKLEILQWVGYNRVMKYIWEFVATIFKESGAVGVASIVGGIILLIQFSFKNNCDYQLLSWAAGIFLILLSIIIAYVRLQNQKAREQALLKTVENVCNRLAEQMAKNLNDHQSDTIAQKIRMIIDHATDAITRWDSEQRKNGA